MDLNDLFLKSVLVILVSSLIFFVYIFYTKSNLDNSITSTQLSESEKQLLKEYFNDPAVKDNLDKTYLDKISELYTKNYELLLNEINRLNQIMNKKEEKLSSIEEYEEDDIPALETIIEED